MRYLAARSTSKSNRSSRNGRDESFYPEGVKHYAHQAAVLVVIPIASKRVVAVMTIVFEVEVQVEVEVALQLRSCNNLNCTQRCFCGLQGSSDLGAKKQDPVWERA